MTDFADLKTSIAEWANRQDWSDALVTSFVRMAESKFNQELRVGEMIEFAENIVTCPGPRTSQKEEGRDGERSHGPRDPVHGVALLPMVTLSTKKKPAP